MIFTLFDSIQYGDNQIADILKNLNHYFNLIKGDFQFRDYNLEGTPRPETLANNLYGDPNLYWVFFLINGITDPFNEWIQSMNEVQTRTDYRYQWVGGGDVIDHYVDERGREWFDIIEYPPGSRNWHSTDEFGNPDRFVYFGAMVPVTVSEHEHELNERFRKIKVVPPEDIRRFVSSLQAVISEYTTS
ncbi:baseplate wedge subunit [Vibrio phage EniLVp02]